MQLRHRSAISCPCLPDRTATDRHAADHGGVYGVGFLQLAAMTEGNAADGATAFGWPANGARTRADDIDELVALTESADRRERQVGVRNLCTCHVQSDDDRVWERLLMLFDDPDPRVRGDVLHAMTDSTPTRRVEAVVTALEARYHDPELRLRRRIRKTLAHYRRTGQITDAAR